MKSKIIISFIFIFLFFSISFASKNCVYCTDDENKKRQAWLSKYLIDENDNFRIQMCEDFFHNCSEKLVLIDTVYSGAGIWDSFTVLNNPYDWPKLAEAYLGQVRNSDLNGYGQLHYKDGSVYFGTFLNSLFHGEGTIYSKNFKYSGNWENGNFYGDGVFEMEGYKAEGYFLKGNIFRGKEIFEGKIYEGEFEIIDDTSVYHGTGFLKDIKSGDTYEGGFKNGTFHGYGKLTQGSVVAEGIWENGEFKDLRGPVLITQDNLESFKTDFQKLVKSIGAELILPNIPLCEKRIVENWNNCIGLFIKKDELTYFGTWNNGEKNGVGLELIYSEMYADKQKYMYVGEWSNGDKDGKGVLINNGNAYRGDFKYSKKHGFGEMIFENGDKYLGNFDEEVFHGKGTFFPINKDRIIDNGLWEENKLTKRINYLVDPSYNNEDKENLEKFSLPICDDKEIDKLVNCKGIIIYENGVKYIGEFKNEEELYQGRMYDYEKKDLYIGQFRNKKFNGKGILISEDGSRYEGEWKEGKKNGKGLFTAKKNTSSSKTHGLKYEGEYKNGLRDGKGLLIKFNGDIYEGDFKNNLPHGKGILKVFETKKEWRGIFENGVSLKKQKYDEKIQAKREKEELRRQKKEEKIQAKREKEEYEKRVSDLNAWISDVKQNGTRLLRWEMVPKLSGSTVIYYLACVYEGFEGAEVHYKILYYDGITNPAVECVPIVRNISVLEIYDARARSMN